MTEYNDMVGTGKCYNVAQMKDLLINVMAPVESLNNLLVQEQLCIRHSRQLGHATDGWEVF